ncbi:MULTISPECIES: lytic transglycosylase domain-containing protein [Klebsiella/Raoultella group]|uniref:lytic transglycosylase domain-containing protein n=1 Tax=Klebsiella/Raoultella group TaxID=2890311 RepID=UPI000C223B5B|nr:MULTISPECIES: lytic transglycosylase domain-containing protein [Klebsiella/Raoultella group]EGH0543360.1 lytic transglycosylase domain-containing protein [Escherichia coli]EIX9601189.1 transglycosylase SLT domain-containing protein [Klebsiella pneumoniae]ELA1023723.1 transglycosylase SLT domain-containing protein [Klebsiella pneumoniae]MBM7159437.1 transglycosylase SLT domain-containing protein [Klebsiella pneumoniae]MCB3268649.1 transglycosylase SLT domain-containing protein [Klebsiella pn
MNAETLKDFLISLGFNVDEAGAKKFDAVVAGTTLKAIELGVKVEAAALSVVAFTAKISSSLDNLYWASQRTGATVEGIKQIGYAVSQVGGSADSARGSLENLARFIRNNPGAEGFLNRLGVQTRDASGNMRDMATIFTGVGQRLSNMPYYRANQYAQMLGLDENTLMAMRRGIGQFSGEYTAMAKAIGYNADVAAVSSNKFMTSLRSFGLMAGMARDKIGSSLADGLAGSLDRLRRQILDNFPKIEGAITAGVKGVLWFGEIIGRVVYRLIQLTGDIINWWKSLSTETRQVIEVFGALMIAWRLLNSAFAMSPIGRVIMLGAALIGLYDDYRTWKEGGQSLIDWGKWEPGIKYAQKAFSSLSKDFGGIYVKVKDLGSAIVDLGKRFLEFINIDTSKFNGKWLFDQIIESVRSSIKILGSLVDALRKVISGDFSGAWDSLKGAAAAWSDSPVIQGAASVGQGLWDKAVDWWNGDATQYGQSVKRPSPSKAGAQLLGWMAPMMGKLESMYNLPSGLLRSVAITESGGNQFAVSGAGAQGMFQFMPGTARDMGLRGNDVFDPIKSAEAAARYLSMLLQKNGGDLGKALASYNWGIGNVQKYGMALMPQETRQYIPKVLSNMPGVGATLNQNTVINISGVSDPREAGKIVSDSQSNVNARATQQLTRGPS